MDIEIDQMEPGLSADDEENIIRIYQSNDLGLDKATVTGGDEGEWLAGSKQYRYVGKPSMNSIQHEQGFAYSQ